MPGRSKISLLVTLARPYFPSMLLVAVTSISAAAITQLLPYLLGEAVRQVASNSDRGQWSPTFSIIIAFLVISAFLQEISIRNWFRIAPSLMRTFYREIVSNYMRQNDLWSGKHEAGGLLGRANHGVQGLEKILDIIFMNILPTTTVMIVVGALMFWENVYLGAIFSSAAGVTIWASLQYARTRISESIRTANAEWVNACYFVADVFENISIVKEYDGLDRVEARKVDRKLKAWETSTLAALKVQSNFSHALGGAVLTLKVSVIFVALDLHRRGLADLGTVAYASVAVLVASGYIRNIGQVVTQTQAAWLDLVVALDLVVIQSPTPQTPGSTLTSPVVHSGRYGSAVDDLADHLLANPGTIAAVWGPSGAGKSTFLRALRLSIMQLSRASDFEPKGDLFRFRVSYLHQRVELFNRSLEENINVLGIEADERLSRLVSALELDDLLSEPYASLDAGRGPSRSKTYSGGERQRIALARTLFSPSRILLLDEPSSALDVHLERRIAASLPDLLERRSCAIATHSTTLRDIASVCVELERGNATVRWT